MAWPQGKILQNGEYIIEGVLGRGGFGITYLATARRNQNQVAIKTVNDSVQSSKDFTKCQQEFEKEARRLQKCSRHRHIVWLDDIIQEGSVCCIVMEFVGGETLATYVTRKGALSEEEALMYIRQIGEALILVHQNGLLHRDVNPRNIMLRANKHEAVLIDFGIAREFIPDKTQSHTRYVSDGYAPPEQHVRKRKRGAYTDIYALSATLYFLVTGQEPLPALDRLYGEPLAPPRQLKRNISEKTNGAILKGLELDPEARPQHMEEWLNLLPFYAVPPTFLQSQSEPSLKDESEQNKKGAFHSFKTILFFGILNLISYLFLAWFLIALSAPIWIWFITAILATSMVIVGCTDKPTTNFDHWAGVTLVLSFIVWVAWFLYLAWIEIDNFLGWVLAGTMIVSIAFPGALLLFFVPFGLQSNISQPYKKSCVLILTIAAWLGLLLGHYCSNVLLQKI